MILPDKAISYLADHVLPEHISQAIDQSSHNLNSVGVDRWGMQPKYLKASLAPFWHLYRNYFDVKVHGLENLPKGRCMLIANHSGQIPFDAVLITLALLDHSSPRIVRSMVEHWVPTLPFIGEIFTRSGQMVGEPNNAIDLLNNDETLLIFPEGVRGIGKPYKNRYQLQNFGTGFTKIAIESKSPIQPVAVIGAEEIYPSVGEAKWLAKLLKTPYFPLTPTFPWLGALGAVPMPSKIDLYFAKPIQWRYQKNNSESELKTKTLQVKESIQSSIKHGLSQRHGRFYQYRNSPKN